MIPAPPKSAAGPALPPIIDPPMPINWKEHPDDGRSGADRVIGEGRTEAAGAPDIAEAALRIEQDALGRVEPALEERPGCSQGGPVRATDDGGVGGGGNDPGVPKSDIAASCAAGLPA